MALLNENIKVIIRNKDFVLLQKAYCTRANELI